MEKLKGTLQQNWRVENMLVAAGRLVEYIYSKFNCVLDLTTAFNRHEFRVDDASLWFEISRFLQDLLRKCSVNRDWQQKINRQLKKDLRLKRSVFDSTPGRNCI